MNIPNDVIQIIFSVLGSLALYILNDLKRSVGEATRSISRLNEQIGVIVARTERHDKEIEEIKLRQDSSREKIHELANDINGLKSHKE